MVLVNMAKMLGKLLKLGISDYLKQKAKERYLAGKVTLSEAARMANITIWEMQRYLVEECYLSKYSSEDLETDLKIIK